MRLEDHGFKATRLYWHYDRSSQKQHSIDSPNRPEEPKRAESSILSFIKGKERLTHPTTPREEYSALDMRITDRLDPNLKVNWVASQSEIDYLDTVVYPVHTRQLVYRIYTKTRVKSTQTFQYLPWRSAHLPQSKLAWIKAESFRHRTINSTETRLYESIMRFYMHLRWRGYPPRILNKWFKESLHSNSNNSSNKSTLYTTASRSRDTTKPQTTRNHMKSII
ncbi:hypothetical protein V1517DRAFT_157057 [Lipomyces orientalis]|uniref:Uncharacterized protein n=1 Tax=Lipomyces orientalis TaxID=1233043 RepID=A0ACC3TL33_9ASCO